MARQLRIEFEGAFYHVTSRGNLREKVFFEDKEREKFIEILRRTKERYGYFLHAYVLMDNHYHLLIETLKANISQIMQNINTSYTVYVNKKHKRSGHLFQGRFKGIIVDKDEYLIGLSRYIHLNPIRAAMVQRPEDYQWSSYKAYRNNSGDALVHTADTLSYFSKNKEKALKAYQAFIEEGIEGKENPLKKVEGGILLGGKEFKEKIRRLLDKREVDEEIPQIKRLRGEAQMDKVIKTCSSFYGKQQDDLLKRGKEKPERQIGIYLSKILSGKKNVEIGKFFGIKGPAVSGVMRTIEGRLENDKKLRQEIAHLIEKTINDK
jgi:REP element-mobilizing transposase RayT